MPCDICGKGGPLVSAKVEGTLLRLCTSCSKFGEVVPETRVIGVPLVRAPPVRAPRRAFSGHRPRPIEAETALAGGYGGLVRSAREKRSLSQGDLARKVNERESLIRQIEHEHIKPDEKTTKKLEKFLSIKLLTAVEEVELTRTKSAATTLADIVKMRKK